MMTARTAAALMITAASLQAQGDAPRTEPARASVYVTLAAEQRTPIAKDRLTLMLDGVPQDIVTCAGGPHPLNVIALVDFSSTMHFHRATPAFPMTDYGSDRVFDKLLKGLPRIMQPADRIRFVSFARDLVIGPETGPDPKAIRNAFRAVHQEGGPSPLWDALIRTIDTLEAAAGRRVIIVYTDARATGNDHRFADVLARIIRSDVAVYALGLPDSPQAQVIAEGRNETLRRLAEESGGTFVLADTSRGKRPAKLPGDMGKWLLENIGAIVEDARQQYRIDFAPAVSDGVHTVTVRLDGNEIGMRTRRHLTVQGRR